MERIKALQQRVREQSAVLAEEKRMAANAEHRAAEARKVTAIATSRLRKYTPIYLDEAE